MSNISIFGLGYVGCVGIGCLAQHGHTIIGVDPQAAKVDFINAGKPTIIEAEIDEILAEAHRSGRIRATTNAREAVLGSDISFICVGTPSTPNGHLDLRAIEKVAEEIGAALRDKASKHVIAIRSTVLPGTNEKIAAIVAEASGKQINESFAIVSNPEFLREGTSVADFNQPPFTLLGSHAPWALGMMREIYAKIPAPVLTVEPKTAELMKYVCNSFHALKITFANEVGNICEKLGIDGRELMEIFCRDDKLNISKAYLRPGFAYGGSCLPKDLKALRTIAHDHYLQTPVLESIERSNEYQKDIVFRKIIESGVQKVGFIGLAFKSGTDDLRDSPIVEIIEKLLGKGFDVRIYDPYVHVAQLTGANRQYILQRIPFISRFLTDDLAVVSRDSELLVIVNKFDGLGEMLGQSNGTRLVLNLAGVRPTRTSLNRVESGVGV